MARYHNPVRITMGAGSFEALDAVVGGRQALLVTTAGTRTRLGRRIEAALGSGLAGVVDGVEPNPTVAACEALHDASASVAADVVLAVGGGSALDAAKAVAALRGAAEGPGWLGRHLRDGEEVPEGFAPPPLVAVPTTAGTGSEVTSWGTIWCERSGAKYSVSHPALYPEAALVDPEPTVTLSEETTTAGALDALSHAMEAIWNRNANPVSDELAVAAIRLLVPGLPEVLEAPSDLDRREQVQRGSLLAGLAFSNTQTALAHSISYPLTGTLGLTHGFACSFTLPEILAVNAEADPARAALIVAALGTTSVENAVGHIRELFSEVDLPGWVRRRVPGPAAIDSVEARFVTPGRADNNLAEVDEAGAREIARRALAVLDALESTR